jgi:hypothetical protein
MPGQPILCSEDKSDQGTYTNENISIKYCSKSAKQSIV